jgi:hypothetical protein
LPHHVALAAADSSAAIHYFKFSASWNLLAGDISAPRWSVAVQLRRRCPIQTHSPVNHILDKHPNAIKTLHALIEPSFLRKFCWRVTLLELDG